MTKARSALNRGVFFIGWLLSPLTFWNDALVNIPISYLCASLTRRVIPGDFLILTLVYYWISNILGLWMMAASGHAIIKEGRGLLRGVIDLLATIAVYSGILILLGKTGLLKPI
jgi:hypothetical protein